MAKKEIKEENKQIKPLKEAPNLGQESAKVADFTINLTNPEPKVKGIRLNIGSGVDYKPDFLNIDKYDPTADADWDIAHLPLRDNSVAQITCYSTLEHLPQGEIQILIKEWHRVLKTDGTVVATVPDIVGACERLLKDPEDDWALARIYGHQANEGQFHKSGFTPKRLYKYFGSAGFRRIGIAYFEEDNKVKNIFIEAVK